MKNDYFQTKIALIYFQETLIKNLSMTKDYF